MRDPVAELRCARAEESVPLVQDPDEGGRPGASGHVGELLGKWADTTGHRFWGEHLQLDRVLLDLGVGSFVVGSLPPGFRADQTSSRGRLTGVGTGSLRGGARRDDPGSLL